jgi:hypothetical protein
MKRELKLFWDTEDGMITDGKGNQFDFPYMAEAAQVEKQFHTKGRDIVGDVTITGNLTVQESSHVYLKGPITGSGLLANGWVTASEVYIRNNNRGDGGLRMEGELTLIGDGRGNETILVRDSLQRVHELRDVPQRLSGLSQRMAQTEGNVDRLMTQVAQNNVGDVKREVGLLKSEINHLREKLNRFGVEELEKELKGLRDDLNILMSIIHK